MKTFYSVFLVCCSTTIVLIAAGCGGSEPQASTPYVTAQDSGIANNATTHHRTPYIYLGQCCRGSVTLYDLQLARITRTITHGVGGPTLVTVDTTGRIYVVDAFACCYGVAEYDAGQEVPSRHMKLRWAVGAATDASNDLYVATCPSCHPYIRGTGVIKEYRVGTTVLLRSIRDGIVAPQALKFDSKGNLYVLNVDRSYDTQVLVYAPGSSKPERTIAESESNLSQMAFDSSDNLYVMRTPNGQHASVVEYKAYSSDVVRTITTGISSPQALTLDSSGTLYVSNTPFPSNGWVSEYAPGQTRPSYKITAKIADPQLVAVDEDRNLYVGNDYYSVGVFDHGTASRNYGGVCVYAPLATKPIRCVGSSRDGFPYSLAVNPQ